MTSSPAILAPSILFAAQTQCDPVLKPFQMNEAKCEGQNQIKQKEKQNQRTYGVGSSTGFSDVPLHSITYGQFTKIQLTCRGRQHA